MRIAIVAPPWVSVPPPKYGGTEAVLDTLARGLQAAGHDVLLAAAGDSTCPVPMVSAHDHAVGVGLGGSAAELRHVIRAYDAVADGGFDVVHDHTLVGPVYAQGCSTPVVTTNHGPFDGDLSPLYRAIARRVPVIAISHHQASTARAIPIAAVIHHGVDPERFRVGRGGGPAVFLGRMCADKGVHTAIRVARAAGVPLRIAAKMREPHEIAYFDDVIRPMLGRDVEFVGEVGGDDKQALLGEASCLLNPIGWDEPFGMVMIEALACGTPVLVTPRGAAPEIVDDGVTGFVRATESDLADCLRRLDHLDREACRLSVEVRFSAQRMVAEHVALYERVAEKLLAA